MTTLQGLLTCHLPGCVGFADGDGAGRSWADTDPLTPGWPGGHAAAWRAARAQWEAVDDDGLAAAARECRGSLRVADLSTVRGAQALGLVTVAMKRTLGLAPYDQQAHAAWLMLQGRFVEMATGEGKTLAAGLAAATAALAGQAVHVMTANDYLVQRDRDAMAPLFALLGLGSAAVVAPMTRADRLAAYGHDIVYVTGREVVFEDRKSVV
jgi:preprotein translocase subunit SecA